MPGWKIPACKTSDKDLKHYFITCERDPSADVEQAKAKFQQELLKTFGRGNIDKLWVVAEAGSKTEYAHMHAGVKLKHGTRWKKHWKQIQQSMYFDKKKFKDGKKVGISVWMGKARCTDQDPVHDWFKYVTRPGVKQKHIDQNGPMEFEEDPEYQAWYDCWHDANGKMKGCCHMCPHCYYDDTGKFVVVHGLFDYM